MNSLDKVKLTGELEIFLNGETVRKVSNLVVTSGQSWVASRMNADTAGIMTHMAIGTGTTTALVADTALETEAARVALNTSGGAVSTNTITYEATYAADVPDVTAPATAAITEAGIFNDVTAGTMLAHTVFAAVNKGETDTMTISWTITLA